MKKILLWAPCLDKVGTYYSVINSAIALNKYSKKKFLINIINACGEWDDQKDFFKKKNIEVIDLTVSYFKFLPKRGYIGSRFSYILISIISFFPLIAFLSKNRSSYFIAHLITLMPLILCNSLNLNSKFILRISGFPKLNFLRKNIWKYFSKKIYKIACPSNDLKVQLLEMGLFNSDKLFFVPDPILDIHKFISQTKDLKKKKMNIQNNFFIAVGRLTRQKNFKYLISEYSNFLKSSNSLNQNLLIFGEGEERKNLQDQINYLKLNDKIKLMGFTDEIYTFMKKADAFILSSLWEDPGFVIVEAALCNLFIISSNCKNGPSELLENGRGGILFETNKKNALRDALFEFYSIKDKYDKVLISKKNCKKFTLFNYNESLKKLILN